MDHFAKGDFLQGFIEEADEHLQTINRLLLRLERTARQEEQTTGALSVLERKEMFKDLFRSFHTLKGMSAMVGLKEAVSLSHALETLLLALEREEIEVSQAVIDQLFSGTRMLSTVVETVHTPGKTMPDVDEELDQIESFVDQAVKPHPVDAAARQDNETDLELKSRMSLADTLPDVLIPQLGNYPAILKALGDLELLKIYAAYKANNNFYLSIFFPSAERSEQGENVDQIRAQIAQTGTLIKAVPDLENGRIRFLVFFATPHTIQPGSMSADETIPLIAEWTLEPVVEKKKAEPQPARTGVSSGISTTLVRVELERLEEMIRYTGDLMQLRVRLVDQFEQLDNVPGTLRREFQQTADQVNRKLRDLRRSILRARMVPLAETFNQMPLVVRDIARVAQKEVQLVMRGEGTEVDKMLVERLREPLIHMVRNAVIHGIEAPDERVAAGKSQVGALMLTGIPQGDHIVIEVSDDGRGINVESVRAKAVANGLLEPDVEPDSEELLALISRPGFSTRSRADEGSGRGVGLDVVQRMVHAFGGKLSLDTSPQGGTKFRMRMPLTMVILDVFMVQAGNERYAVPRNSVLRIEEIAKADIVSYEGGELVQRGEDYSVLHRLDHLIQGQRADNGGAKLFGLVPDVDSADGKNQRHMVTVDRVLDLREVVVRTLSDPFVAKPGIAGATELSDGLVVLILDLPMLLRQVEKG